MATPASSRGLRRDPARHVAETVAVLLVVLGVAAGAWFAAQADVHTRTTPVARPAVSV